MNNKDCQTAANEQMAAGHVHGHIHGQIDEHLHARHHGQICPHIPGTQQHADSNKEKAAQPHDRNAGTATCLALRCHSGISGDMLLCALASLHLADIQITPDSSEADAWLNGLTTRIMPELAESVVLRKHQVNCVGGLQAQIKLPHCHEHRNMADIGDILQSAQISHDAKKIAGLCFDLLAVCEAAVHGITPMEVHFHEVGGLDSILDICISCEIYCQLQKPKIYCSPLPMTDGSVNCSHGILPAPAPAVLKLLEGIPVMPFGGAANAGELVTPTGLALLKAMDAEFGPWPAMRIHYTSLVYGQKVFADAANGLICALGSHAEQI